MLGHVDETGNRSSALREETALNSKRIATVVTLVLLSAAGGYQLKAHAQQQYPPACNVVVPVEWGDYKGISAGAGIVFQDKNGTLRIISEIPCSADRSMVGTPRVTVEIHRK